VELLNPGRIFLRSPPSPNPLPNPSPEGRGAFGHSAIALAARNKIQTVGLKRAKVHSTRPYCVLNVPMPCIRDWLVFPQSTGTHALN